MLNLSHQFGFVMCQHIYTRMLAHLAKLNGHCTSNWKKLKNLKQDDKKKIKTLTTTSAEVLYVAVEIDNNRQYEQRDNTS